MKWTVVLTFLTLVPWVPLTTFFWTFWAFCTCLTGALRAVLPASSDFSVFFGTGFLPALAGNDGEKILISRLENSRVQNSNLKVYLDKVLLFVECSVADSPPCVVGAPQSAADFR